MKFVQRSRAKAMGEHGIKWGSKTLLYLRYVDDLSILDENVSIMNELLEVWRVQGVRKGLTINIKNTRLLRLGISKGKVVMLYNKKIRQVDKFTFPGRIIGKDGG